MKPGGAIVALMLAFPPAALAQDAAPAAAVPSQAMPAMPEATPPAAAPTAKADSAQAGYFPALPPSRSCTGRDIIGMWKLLQVYESPSGEWLRDFATYPFQFMLFDRDTTVRTLKTERKPQGNMQAQAREVYKQPATRQYVLHSSGIVFYYENSVATDSHACFIVANPQGSFEQGMMLLMPPAPADGSVPKTRLVSVYRKVWLPGKQSGQKGQQPRKKNTRHYRRAN